MPEFLPGMVIGLFNCGVILGGEAGKKLLANRGLSTRLPRREARRLIISGLTVLLVFLVVVATPGWARDWQEVFQRDAVARRTFRQGLADYQQGDFDRAEKKFRSLLPAARPRDEEAVALFIGKCLLGQRLSAEAEDFLLAHLDDSPAGRYPDVFRFLAANAAYLNGKPLRAVEFYLAAYDQTADPRLKIKIMACLTPLFARWLDEPQLRQLAGEIASGAPAAELHYQWGQRAEKRGRLAQAQQNYREVVRLGRDNRHFGAAKERLSSLRRQMKDAVRIGLLYPATGNLAEFGDQMVRAARLAIELWQQDRGGYIELIAEDTQGESLGASKAARRLLTESVDAVVGPLTSRNAAAAASMLACTGGLHILPVASEAGLTELSENLYQLNCTPVTVGRVLAEYAVDSLKATTFAVLAADDLYGRRVSREFQKTAVEKGALVFPVQFSTPGQTDYRTELMRIKRIVLRELYDSTVFFTPDGDTLDDEQVPVYLGGFLLPGDAEDLSVILQHIRFYNIFARFLGTDGWSNPALLERARDRLDGAVFGSPEHHPSDDRQWRQFRTAWMKRYSDEPDFVAARTFDAVNLAVDAQSKTKKESGRQISLPAVFHGAGGIIKFTARRENSYLPLWGYQKDKIIPAHLLPPPKTDPKLIGPPPPREH